MSQDSSSKASGGDDNRYRLLVDAITDYAIYMLDPTGKVSSWNAGAQRFKGYTADEIIGQNFSLFYTPEDRANGMPAQALRTAQTEGRFEREAWRVRKNGERFWAHVLIDPIYSPQGELIGFAKVTRDLTERRAAEETLRRSQEQFRLLVQGVTDYAIYMLDPTGRVTNWNAGAQRIKGYRPNEIIGKHFSRFYTEPDRAAQEPARALSTAAAEGRFEKEGWRVRKTGERFWAHVVIDPIRDEDGHILGFAKITRDITERRKAQEELEIARQALFQSQKLDAIGQLTGGIAHDFNNLLMAVLGSLELLRKRLPDDDAKARSLLDNALQGAERGAALTQRMLAFARKQELKLEPVDVGALVEGMTGLMERSLGPEVRLQVDFPHDRLCVRTDANQLETALLNLAVNARDAMPSGGVITITAEDAIVGLESDLGLPPGPYVRLMVMDQGQGMDAETLSRASEPFFTTKGVGKGTGLGLSMVHGLVEQSGGRLLIHSQPGFGTRVEIWLPKADADQRAAAPPVEAEPPTQARPMTVLAVDDDSLVLNNLASMLEDLGHTALTSESAAGALDLLQKGGVDLVITDHAMPQMTGLDLAGEIERRHPDVPVILATGYAELPPGEGESLPRLAKPYSQGDLARMLAQQAPAPLREAVG